MKYPITRKADTKQPIRHLGRRRPEGAASERTKRKKHKL